MDKKQQVLFVKPTTIYPERKRCLVLTPGELYKDSRPVKADVYMFLGYKVDTYYNMYTYVFLSGDEEIQFKYIDCEHFTPVTSLDHVK